MINVYLISSEIEGKKLYKIGYTRKDVSKRINQLRTGNPGTFEIVDSFSSKWGTKIEANLHRQFKYKKVNGEWFDLTNEDISKFKSKCELLHNNFEVLTKTTFYLERGKFY